MSDKKHERTSPCDIDALLQDTWLQVISLRHGPRFQDGEGLTLWQQCVADVERVQQALAEADIDEAGRQHILYAQCALIDETVKGRGVQDDACVQWYDVPLQGHFLGTLDAGDALCDRMRDVLREPAPDSAVLTCFHRVLMLGFLGSYPSASAPERERLVNALHERVPAFRFPQTQPVLAGGKTGRRLQGVLSSWCVRIGLSILILAGLWWGLDSGLSHLLTTLLPGTVK